MNDDTSDIGVRRGHMLMVIPSNLEFVNGNLMLDGDFAKYLRLYLDGFESVVVACPIAKPGSFPTLEPLENVEQDRLRVVVLPEPYREDRYLFSYLPVRRLLIDEIEKSDFVVVAPHSAFEWSTLAAKLSRKLGKPYNMEADWNLQQVNWSTWQKLPWGINKVRRFIWMKLHDPQYFRAMRHSTVALLHGHDVYEAYREIAPNPQVVNNFRVTATDRINSDALTNKLASVRANNPLEIVYSGRAIEMKGPFEWLNTLLQLRDMGVKFKARWYGEGEALPRMQSFVQEHDLQEFIMLPGRVDRSVVFEALFRAHIFLFCHLTRESPRNLVEALAAGAPIVGFGSPYSHHLVEEHGGSEFVDVGEVNSLAKLVAALNENRSRLAELIGEAAKSGQQFDRNNAVNRRIELMKQYMLS